MLKQKRLYEYLGQTESLLDARIDFRCRGIPIPVPSPAVLFGHCSEAPHMIAYSFVEGTGYGDAYSLPSLPLENSGGTLFLSPSGRTVIAGDYAAPYARVYNFSLNTGFSAELTAPTDFSDEVKGAAFHPNSTAVVLYEQEGSPSSIRAYPLTEGTGLGTKYSDPVSPPPSILGIRNPLWHPSGNAIICVDNASPFYHAYPFNLVTGFGTKYSNPSSLPTTTLYNTTYNSDMSVLLFTSNSTPYIQAWQFDPATGFGTKYSDPGTLPSTLAIHCAFSPTDGSVLISRTTSPYVTSYVFDYTTGFGAKHADLSPALAGSVRAIAFHPSGGAVVLAHNTSPYIAAYPWDDATGAGVKYTNPTTAIPGNIDLLRFTPSGDTLLVTHSGSPYVTAYPFSIVDGFGEAYTPPSGLPTTYVQAVHYIPGT